MNGIIGVIPDYRGRLGNQMFRIAAAIGVARQQGYDAVISRCRATEIFGITAANRSSLLHLPAYHERHFHFDPGAFGVSPGHVLYGYFQSERYFDHCPFEIRSIFQFKETSPVEAVAVHVRRGDYLGLVHRHPPPPISYYDEALRRFKGMRTLVFSDDTEWCKGIERFRNCEIIEGQSDGGDLALMARCMHQVIANSSFSWWAAWLNENPDKVVYYPRVWFGPDGPRDWHDLPPPSWQPI